MMENQPSVRPYERTMPKMPEGTVPSTGSLGMLTTKQAALKIAPIRATAANINQGSIYYNRYCEMCHGPRGKGDGKVGTMYKPPPVDLTSGRTAGLTDGGIYHAMLTGPGHGPVLEKTVLPQYRWPLVLYVRRLASGAGPMPRLTGRQIFETYCAPCHGPNGNKMPDWKLKVRGMSTPAIQSQVRNGGGGMPPFKSRLSNDQISRVSDYVRHLASK